MARMSLTSVNGLDGDSRKNSRVLDRAAARQASGSVGETKVVSMPNLPRILLNNCTVEPKIEREATTCSPARIRPITVARMAAMPDENATQRSAPSRAARRDSNMVTEGLVKRA